MTMIKPIIEILDIVAEETNCKCLDVFREQDQYEFHIAKLIDHHLNDLGKRITMALSEAAEMPEPDEFEEWLLEKHKAGQLQPVAQALAGSAVEIEEVETTESNESPTTDSQQQPETARVDNVSGSHVSGGEPDTPDQDERGPGYLKALVEAWKVSLDCSNLKLAELAGVSDPTIGQILHGRKVSDATRDKVLAAIEKQEALSGVMAVPEKLNGAGDQKRADHIKRDLQNGGGHNDAGSFIQLQLITWMRLENIGIHEASGRLMVQESALRLINKGQLPHSNIVRQLARHIPAIEAQQSMLMHAAEQREAA